MAQGEGSPSFSQISVSISIHTLVGVPGRAAHATAPVAGHPPHPIEPARRNLTKVTRQPSPQPQAKAPTDPPTLPTRRPPTRHHAANSRPTKPPERPPGQPQRSADYAQTPTSAQLHHPHQRTLMNVVASPTYAACSRNCCACSPSRSVLPNQTHTQLINPQPARTQTQ